MALVCEVAGDINPGNICLESFRIVNRNLAAFALGLLLFFVTLLLNVIALYVVRKYREQYE